MPFQYQGWTDPYAASIGDQIARSADAVARAKEISGQVWGDAARNIGNIPSNVVAIQNQQTEAKLKQQELAMTVEQRAEQARQRVVMGTGRIFGMSQTPDDAARALDSAAQAGVLPPDTVAHIKTQLQTATDPETYRSLRQQYVDFADSYTQPTPLHEGDSLIRTSVGGGATTIASAPKIVNAAPGSTIAAVSPGAPGTAPTATPLLTAPNRPIAVNGQIVQPDTATPVGAAIPKQEGATEAALNQAKVGEITKNLALIDQKLNGTEPIQPAERERLNIERAGQQLQLSKLQIQLNHEDPQSTVNQEKLEQQYRQVARATISSRSGVYGTEDSKVVQAKHLVSLMEQYKDPRTGQYTIPKSQYAELATGLAALIAPQGRPSDSMRTEIEQRTAKGDFNGALTYITGTPFSGSTQDVFTNLRDSIERQGMVAEGNREKELDNIKAQAPTDLKPERRTSIEAGFQGLNRMSDVGVLPGGHHVGDIVTKEGHTYKIRGVDAQGNAVLDLQR